MLEGQYIWKDKEGFLPIKHDIMNLYFHTDSWACEYLKNQDTILLTKSKWAEYSVRCDGIFYKQQIQGEYKWQAKNVYLLKPRLKLMNVPLYYNLLKLGERLSKKIDKKIIKEKIDRMIDILALEGQFSTEIIIRRAEKVRKEILKFEYDKKYINDCFDSFREKMQSIWEKNHDW